LGSWVGGIGVLVAVPGVETLAGWVAVAVGDGGWVGSRVGVIVGVSVGVV
jgi:hypothetical protein